MNSLAKRLRYEISDLNQEFREILDNFLSGVQTETVRNVLGKNLSQQIKSEVDEIANRLQTPFFLVVVGDFKRGKSTLINALLKQEVVTTDITPETVTLNQIQSGPELKIEACLTDGGRIGLDAAELKAEQLTALLGELSQKVSHLNIEVPNEWLEGLCLVDTPGTGDIFQRFDPQVHDYLEKADAVIFVISALSPLSASEQAFLQLSVLPQDFSKVFLVVNMMDLLSATDQAERLLHSIRTKMSGLFPHVRLFALSAYDEMCRLQSLPPPNPERHSNLAEDFQTFRDALEESVLLNRGAIQLNRASNQMEETLQKFKSNIALLRHSLQAEQGHLSQIIAQCEDESSELYTQIQQQQTAIRADMKGLAEEACGWMNEFINRLETQAVDTLPEFELADIRRYYQFFLTDAFRKALSSCLDAHHPAMIASADKAAQTMTEALRALTETDPLESELAQATFGKQQWTNLDTFQLVIDFSPLKAIADVLIHHLRESKQSSQIRNYQQQLKKMMPQLNSSIREQVQSLYEQISRQIEEEVARAYKQDIETSLQAVKQARETFALGAQEMNAAETRLQEALSKAEETHSQLKDLKQKLWYNLGEL